MDLLIAILTLVLLLVVILVISAPLRVARRAGGIAKAGEQAAEDRAELEAAREAKYREIRDAELDYRTGKLSDEDFAATDGALRAEAVELLDRLRAGERES
jgi:flagellar biosynthesis/type III secretory pathway M-ring protein FliF/YscJ